MPILFIAFGAKGLPSKGFNIIALSKEYEFGQARDYKDIGKMYFKPLLSNF